MKIFRFLADMLTEQEFFDLNYYPVSRFISNILRLAFEEGASMDSSNVTQLMSLRQFVYDSLDLKYS